jgi:hypothetical protein
MRGNRLKFKFATATGLTAIAAVLIGCGGLFPNGNGGNGGGGGGDVTRSENIRSAPPAGVTINNPKLVSALTGDQGIGSSGVNVNVVNGGRQLSAILDGDGDPVMMGFVGSGSREINPHTTMVGLLFIYMGGFMCPIENQTTLITSLEQDPELPNLTKEFTTAMVADPKALTNKTAPYRDSLLKIAARILGRPAPSRGIDPYRTAKSGITLEYGETQNDIFASNEFRRRVMMFVERVKQVDGSGIESNNYRELKSVELPAATATGQSADLVSAIFGGVIPSKSETIQLEEVPTNLREYKYKVVFAGAGATAGENYTLTEPQRMKIAAMNKKAFCADFLMNVLNFAVLSTNAGDHSSVATPNPTARDMYGKLQRYVSANEATVLAFVDANFPGIDETVGSGDFDAALTQALQSVFTSDSRQSAIAKFYANAISSISDFPVQPNEATISKMLIWIAKVVDVTKVGELADTAFTRLLPGIAYANSKRVEVFDANTTRIKMTLTPKAPSIKTTGNDTNVTFTSTLNGADSLPAGTTVKYKFTTTGRHGKFTSGSSSVNTVDGTSNTALYASKVGIEASQGTDEVICEAYYEQGTSRIKIATEKASVVVEGDTEIKVLPEKTSITAQRDSTSTSQLSVKTLFPNLVSEGKFKIKWRTESSLFKLEPNPTGSEFAQTARVTTEVNAAEGTGIVFADLVDAKTGKVLGTGQAEVRVERRRSIIFGKITGGGRKWSAPDPYYGTGYFSEWGNWCEFPIPEGATRLVMRCYNFNDTSFYGRSITRTYSVNSEGIPSGPDLSGDLNEYGMPAASFFPQTFRERMIRSGLTGGSSASGSPSNENPFDAPNANKVGRFGGMIVEVTVTY